LWLSFNEFTETPKTAFATDLAKYSLLTSRCGIDQRNTHF